MVLHYFIDKDDKMNSLENDFSQIIEFLSLNPHMLSGRVDPLELSDRQGVKTLFSIYERAVHSKLELAPPKTIPDEAVSVIIKSTLDCSEEKTNSIKVEHQLSMAAENMVGALLERYLYSVLKNHGWVWCAGDFVRAIDFIKRNPDGTWIALQVKNRDNSENSSSSAIRNNTDIIKWFRTYSKPSKRRESNTNWDAFPDVYCRNYLSEDGFMAFINDYLSH